MMLTEETNELLNKILALPLVPTWIEFSFIT